MDGRPVRVTVNQGIHAMRVHDLLHGLLVYIHDFCRFLSLAILAAITRQFGQPVTLSDGLIQKCPLPVCRPDQLPECLVREIVCAQTVPVHQQDTATAHLDNMLVRNELYSTAIGKVLPEKKVSIARQEEYLDPALR